MARKKKESIEQEIVFEPEFEIEDDKEVVFESEFEVESLPEPTLPGNTNKTTTENKTQNNTLTKKIVSPDISTLRWRRRGRR